MINREISIMMRLSHPTIIGFHGYSLTDMNGRDNVTILMNIAKNGSLLDQLQKVQKGLADQNYDNTMRQKILVGIARGMMYLHKHHIIHRDLKPGNIILDEDFNPLITDFGLSKYVDSGQSANQTQYVGTSIYMAPEVISSNHYSTKADVYSFGIIMFEVITDTTPYPLFEKGKLPLFQFNNKVVNEDYRPTFTVPVKDSLKELIEKCWSNNPNERPTFEQLFNKLAFNVEDSIYDVLTPGDFSYYLDDVDIDELFFYVDLITENEDKKGTASLDGQGSAKIQKEMEKMKDEMKAMKREMEDIKKDHEKSINKLSQENKQLKVDNDKMNSEITNLKKQLQTIQLQSSQPANSSQSSQPAKPLQYSPPQPAKPLQYSQPPQPAKPLQYSQPAKPLQYSPPQPANSSQSSQPAKPLQYSPPQPAKPLQYSQPAKPLQYSPPQPANSSQSSQPAKPLQYSQPPQPAKPSQSTIKPKTNGTLYKPQANFRFKGIINFFRSQTSSGKVDKEIHITASSISSSPYAPVNVVLFEERYKYFESDHKESESWICFEFLNHTVRPTHYQIMTAPLNMYGNHPKNWIFEGSNDNSNWEKLDEQSNCQIFNDYVVSSIFSVQNPEYNDFRYIRLHSTGPLCISSFEIYGYLI